MNFLLLKTKEPENLLKKQIYLSQHGALPRPTCSFIGTVQDLQEAGEGPGGWVARGGPTVLPQEPLAQPPGAASRPLHLFDWGEHIVGDGVHTWRSIRKAVFQ